MKLKTLAKKLAFVSALAAASFAASATTTNLGPVAVGIPLSFAGIVSNDVLGFADFFTFTLPANGGSGYSAANFTLLPGAFNTLLTTMSLVSDPDGSVAGANLLNGDELALHSSVLPGGSTLTMSYGANSGGNFFLFITGLGNGTLGGIYTGAISVSAVPEPESYAMLLAGLGVMGAIAIRRNRSKSD